MTKPSATCGGDTCLGILQLANAPFDAPGFVNSQETWGIPIATRQVPGAFVDRIAAQTPGLEEAYVDSARALVAEGADVIGSNCGLTALYQRAVSASVDVPVFTSSLLALAPLQSVLPPSAKIGVLTYDARLCSERLFAEVGADSTRLVTRDLRGTEAFEHLAAAEPALDWRLLERDLMTTARALTEYRCKLHAIVVECTTFGPFVDRIRRETGLPIYDYLWLVESHLRATATRQ